MNKGRTKPFRNWDGESYGEQMKTGQQKGKNGSQEPRFLEQLRDYIGVAGGQKIFRVFGFFKLLPEQDIEEEKGGTPVLLQFHFCGSYGFSP